MQDVAAIFERASELLKDSQDDPTLARLRSCSASVIRLFSRSISQQEIGRGVYQFPRHRVESFTVFVPDDSLDEAGLPKDSAVKFRLSTEWNDGDLAFTVTPDGNFIAFIYRESSDVIRLEGAHPDCPVRTYDASEMLVFGVRI